MKEFAETTLDCGRWYINSSGSDIIGRPCKRMPKACEIWQPHKVTHKGAHSNDGPVAIRIVGVGYNGPVPNDSQAVEIPSSWYRLLHQMGRSRSLGHNHREKCVKLCMEKHHLQIRYTKGVGLR